MYRLINWNSSIIWRTRSSFRLTINICGYLSVENAHHVIGVSHYAKFLKEKIGNPALFTGRKKELNNLLHWVDGIKTETSKSKAIISRRKTGKSAVMQRLFNILFAQNGQVIPFYFEIRETPQWIADFAKEFFIIFICQYIAFKSRNVSYIEYNEDFNQLIQAAKKKTWFSDSSLRGFWIFRKEGFYWPVVAHRERSTSNHCQT
jgi:hypothetical protein